MRYADLLTKYMPAELMHRHLETINARPAGGRAESAPQIDSMEVESWVQKWVDKKVRFDEAVSVRPIPAVGRGRSCRGGAGRAKVATWPVELLEDLEGSGTTSTGTLSASVATRSSLTSLGGRPPPTEEAAAAETRPSSSASASTWVPKSSAFYKQESLSEIFMAENAKFEETREYDIGTPPIVKDLVEKIEKKKTSNASTQTSISLPCRVAVQWHCVCPEAATVVDMSDEQVEEEIQDERINPESEVDGDDGEIDSIETMADTSSVTAEELPGRSTNAMLGIADIDTESPGCDSQLERTPDHDSMVSDLVEV